MCAHALALSGIPKVYFGWENDKFGGNGSILSLHLQTNYKYDSIGGILAEPAIKLLQKFYERGNEKVPEKKRHRKLKQKDDKF